MNSNERQSTITNGSSTEPKNTNEVEGYRTPSINTLQHAYKIAVTDDKPIMFDYWTASLDKTALIGVKNDSNEKLLVKSEEEYTSPISKIFKVSTEYIVITENSIYIIDVNIPTKRIA
jgi:hypothetical protein